MRLLKEIRGAFDLSRHSRWALPAALLLASTATGLTQSSGSVETIGGTGVSGFVDGTKGSSEFNMPTAVAVRGDGRLYIADFNNNAVRWMDLSTRKVETMVSNISHPIGLAFDVSTNLYVASQGSGTITKYDYFHNLRQTLRPALTGGLITALTTDRDGYLYIAQLNNLVTRITPQGFLDATFSAPGGGAHEFRGVAVSDDGGVFVSDSAAQVIWRFNGPGSSAEVFGGTLYNAGGNDGETGVGRLNRPYQIALGLNGSIVVADFGNHQIRAVSCSGIVMTLYGVPSSEWFTYSSPEVFPGWWDSTAEFAELREPYGVAVDRTGNIYDTEVHYNLIRHAAGIGFPAGCGTSGTDSTNSVPIPVLTPNSGFYPNGVSITISPSNSLSGFSRDVRLFYTLDGSEPSTNSPASLPIPILGDGLGHLDLSGPIDLSVLRVRAFLGTLASPTIQAQPAQVPDLILTPNSGYYPMGMNIRVTSTNEFPEGTELYYTTDGSEPGTNSLVISHDSTSGTIEWNVPQKDLRSLKARAFWGPNAGRTTQGTAVNFGSDRTTQGEVGVPPGRGELVAGIGSFYVLPIVVNLRDQQQLKSIQFRVDLAALPGSPRLDRADFQVVPISTNDFIQVLPASDLPPDNADSIAVSGTNRLLIAYSSTAGSFNVSKGYATIALLGIQFRSEDALGNTAEEGDSYILSVANVSGTSDGLQANVPLKAMPARSIRLKNIRFMEGDTAPAFWYNAGDFGDGQLNGADVNSAVYAAFGLRRPFPQSDVFAAMDVNRAGLFENIIDYLDPSYIFRRSLGIDFSDIYRVRNEFGQWEPSTGPLLPPPPAPLSTSSVAISDFAWSRDAVIYGGIADKVQPGASAEVPVYMKVASGRTVAGMQFVADVIGSNGAPSISGATFIPSGAIAAPTKSGNTDPDLHNLPNTVYARWETVEPGLTGTVLLGTIRFVVPFAATAGESYSIVFRDTGGASENLETGALSGYLFESIPGQVWPFVTHTETARVSDDWKAYFFGSVSAPSAAADQDADGDGFSNYEEYLAGTNPNTPNWHVRGQNGQVTIRWVGEMGKTYTVESTADFNAWSAVTSGTAGQDGFMEYNEPAPGARARFYRIKSK
jgi:hypothetical protein